MESLFNHTSVFLKAVKALSEDDQLYTEVEIKTLADKYEEVVVSYHSGFELWSVSFKFVSICLLRRCNKFITFIFSPVSGFKVV